MTGEYDAVESLHRALPHARQRHGQDEQKPDQKRPEQLWVRSVDQPADDDGAGRQRQGAKRDDAIRTPDDSSEEPPFLLRFVGGDMPNYERRQAERGRNGQERRPSQRIRVRAVVVCAELSRKHEREKEVYDDGADVQQQRSGRADQQCPTSGRCGDLVLDDGIGHPRRLCNRVRAHPFHY